MTIGEFIHNRRIELGLTLEEIGNATGVGKSTVKKWETGFISNMRRDRIDALATILKVSPIVFINDYIEDYEAAVNTDNIIENLPENIIPVPKMKKVPLVGTIACGEPITAEENIEDYIDMPEDINGTFALRCKGDSMINARIFDGDIVYIRQQPDVENGEIAAVLIDGEATLKRVYKYHNRIELRPENPTCPVFNYENEELNDIRILGKAVAFFSTVI